MGSSILHLLAVYSWCRSSVVDPCADFVAALDVHVLNVEGVDMAGKVTQDSEQDVDEQIDSAACDEEDTDWGDEDCDDD